MNNASLRLPEDLCKLVAGRAFTRDNIGCSSAGVYRLDGDGSRLWLKTEKTGQGLTREYDVLCWLKGIIPVPEVLYFSSDGSIEYLLTANVTGKMACDEAMLSDPKQTVRLLADGIRLLQSVDISNCPFDNRLEKKLADARENIVKGLVDTSDWENDTAHRTPEELLRYLESNRPAAEDLAFTHGDYCLPNIFFENGDVSGFIDMGRAGIADRWQDIALCIRSLHHNFNTDAYDSYFFRCLGIAPDLEKIRYYILLDELF